MTDHVIGVNISKYNTRHTFLTTLFRDMVRILSLCFNNAAVAINGGTQGGQSAHFRASGPNYLSVHRQAQMVMYDWKSCRTVDVLTTKNESSR